MPFLLEAAVWIFLLLLAPAVRGSVTLLNPLDFLALQSIRKSLRDMPGSHFFSTWDFTDDPCDSFSGVFCYNGRVVALSLGDLQAASPGLTGHLDASIGRLSALTELSLVPGHVYGTIPDTISNLKTLSFLALSRNYLSGHIPPSISFLHRLQTLDLSFNQLYGPIPPFSITNIILCHNRFTGKIPVFTSVARLDLKNNNLSGKIHQLPTSLRYLSLSSNRLSGRIGRIISKLTHLNYIDLSMNRFTGRIPSTIFTFRISHLQLQRNAFGGRLFAPAHVSMETVDVSHNELKGTVPMGLAYVRNLYLNNNRLRGRLPRLFAEKMMSGGIRLLYLQHNYLTGIDMKRKAEIPMTCSLCIGYNCMPPPVRSQCPANSGNRVRRPKTQCSRLSMK